VPVVIVAAGITCLVSVALVEHFVSRKEWGESFALGMAMGVLVAVPYLFVGGIVGTIVLGWAGIYEFQKPLPPPSNPG